MDRANRRAVGDVLIGLRPEHLEIDPKGKGLKVDLVEQLGGVSYVYAITENGERLIVEQQSLNTPKSGDEVGVKFNAKDVYVFDAKSEQRIR